MNQIIKLMSIIKGRTIVLDDKVGIAYLFQLSIEKAFALLRGLLTTRRLVLIGRGTKVYASRQLFVEKGVEIGPYCQIDCLSHKGLFIGRCSKVGAFSSLKVSGTLTDLGQSIVLGENVGIGEFAHIGGAADVKVGSNTIVGAYLSIHPENHIFSDKEALIREQGVSRKGIDVGSNCWIGAKVTILDGSRIGDGCVVAAGAVVNGIFPNNVVIGGVPAKILKER